MQRAEGIPGKTEADLVGWTTDRVIAVAQTNTLSWLQYAKAQAGTKQKLNPPTPIPTPFTPGGAKSDTSPFALALRQARETRAAREQ